MTGIGLLLVLAATSGVVPCLPSTPAQEEALKAQYASGFEAWSENRAGFDDAWMGFVEPLLSLGVSVSFVAYFEADGSLDLVVVRGDEAQVQRACGVLAPLDSYRWPLATTRPFSQCGSVNVVQPDRGEFALTISGTPATACVGEPIPLHAALENVSGASQRFLLLVDGALKDYLNFFVQGHEGPEQLIPHGSPPAQMVTPEDVEPGWKLTGEFDLSGYSLPSNEILGRTPGQYLISAHFSSSGALGTWGGSVWSKPVQVVVEECD